MTYDKDSEISLINEAVSEYFYDLIAKGIYRPFTANHDEAPAIAERCAHEEADYIIERLEKLLESSWQ